MASQRQMLILTSNEDLIRQFAANKPLNTHIIDLNNDQQISSTDNPINRALLAKIFQSNSNQDQLYKQALDQPRPKKLKTDSVRKKSTDLVCVICGDRAIGFNYDAVSCNSCKEFFRRNAHHPIENIRCLKSRGQCPVGYEMRRKCARCRLDKCLRMGMRRDSILTEEQKQEKRKQLEENRCLAINNSTLPETLSNIVANVDDIEELMKNFGDNMLFNDSNNMLLDILSVDDWLTIETVQSAFTAYLYFPHLHCCDYYDLTSETSAIISWSQFVDDRFNLIKYNIFSLSSIGKSYNYKSTNDCCANNNCEASRKLRELFQLCGAPITLYESFVSIISSLVDITDQDPIFLSLLSVILLFSRGLSMSDDESILHDPCRVNQVHLRYTTILWSYLVNKHGEIEAQKGFIRLLQIILRLQFIVEQCRETLHKQLIMSNIFDKIAPLMQAVLHIS
ncbi:unnamed protein product [Adineta ricciae]|uniref:Nuclear receptor domain-containing protein n=1 Tax=Adineta ricciae TaxID=249248 RepID=A0A814SR52_ADIRI|nr:unnamed protein product [Adineta ricciae]